MCGIVGYIGKKSPLPLVVQSLRHLEYRGYDSAGVAFLDANNELSIFKSTGKLINLENILPVEIGASIPVQPLQTKPAASGGVAVAEKPPEQDIPKIAIGHIRWATHGAPNETNAHPHVGGKREIALVHNGIIENYFELRKQLQEQGHVFVSETDTECVVQLLEHIAASEQDNFITVIREALKRLQGAYALSIINKNEPDKLYAVRHQAPLIIGVGTGETEGEFIVASDAVAIVQHTDRLIYLKDNEIAELSPQGIKLFNLEGEPVKPIIEQVSIGPLQIDKKGYKHFMLKEIYEQPDVVRNSLSGRLIASNEPIRLFGRDEDALSGKNQETLDLLTSVRRILVIGCGTSFNAGLVGKYLIEELVQVPVEVESAGEFRYRNPVLDDQTLVITVSQSGETADTLAALRMSAEKGAKILAITNREDSTIAREADAILPVRAGVEVSVCATKSFTAQILVMYLLAIAMAESKKSYHPEQLEHLKSELFKIPALIEAALSKTEPLQALAKKYGDARDILFIARGINFPVALEGALKLKEISYIHAEGYSGSELKHGPIAMLDKNLPVISVLVAGQVFEKMISNCQEAKARDAQMVGISSVDITQKPELAKTFDDLMTIPETHELLSPLITTVPLQLLAYYIAEHLGKDVDQPRNLAKSVTVE
ncbi:MAG: glutamine--fructose-6-phosphate transaminase (isomerizing) [Vampirovibrionales bacterium]|nr:glutamine--fructose-6-phosphate transaminase (isomerizing) [Vampirovibrionales bacterium]